MSKHHAHHHSEERPHSLKMRNLILGYVGMLGVTSTLWILNSIQGLLPAIATKILIALLIASALGLAYGVYWLYGRFHALYHGVQSRRYELREREQRLTIEAERWQIERSNLLLAQHHASTRIYADSKGYMPTIVSIDEAAGHQYIQLPHPAHQARLASAQTEQQALPEQAESREHTIPSTVRYEDIADQIPRGHAVLGVSSEGVETCEFKDLMTMLICGGSNMGKSNTVAIKLHEAIQLGRDMRLIVVDPHGNKGDSLTNKVSHYESRFLMPIARKDEDVLTALNAFRAEFQRRMELTTDELAGLPDILFICDEVYALCFHREDDRIGKLIKVVSGIAGYESRGYGMYAWFITQRVTGLKWLRDAVMTTICHKIQTMSERVLASNDDRAVAKDMNTWGKGRVVVFGLNMPVTVAQMPVFSSQPATTQIVEADRDDDIMEELQPRPAFRVNMPKRSSETERVSADETNEQAASAALNIIAFPVSSQAASASLEKETSGVSDETKKIILRMHRAGMPLRDIAKLVGLAGEKYGTFKQACQELGIQASQVIEG